VLAVPVVDVVVFLVLGEDHVGVAVVELPVELGVLANGLEFLDAVHLQGFFTGFGKELICFRLKLTNMDI
jgi:hypothetical protein